MATEPADICLDEVRKSMLRKNALVNECTMKQCMKV